MAQMKLSAIFLGLMMMIAFASAIHPSRGGSKFRRYQRQHPVLMARNGGKGKSVVYLGKSVGQPTGFRCARVGFYSHETDCTRFYRCVDYWGTGKQFSLFQFQCPAGTMFDPSLSVCNHPSWIQPPPACAGSTAPGSLPGGAATSVRPPVPGTGGSGVQPTTPGVSTGSPITTDSTTESSVGSEGTTQGSIGSTSSGSGSQSTAAPETELPPVIEPEGPLPSPPLASSTLPPDTSSSSMQPEEESTPQSPLGSTTAPTDAGSSSGQQGETGPESSSPGQPGAIETSTNLPDPASSTASTSGPDESSGLPEMPDLPSTGPATSQPDSEMSGQQGTSTTEMPSEQPGVPGSGANQPETEVTSGQQSSTTESQLPDVGISTTVAPSLPAVSTAPFVLICGDQDLHRHPLNCNLYYQCVWNGISFNINVNSCPIRQIFDEASASCQDPEQTKPCEPATVRPPSSSIPTSTPESASSPQSSTEPVDTSATAPPSSSSIPTSAPESTSSSQSSTEPAVTSAPTIPEATPLPTAPSVPTDNIVSQPAPTATEPSTPASTTTEEPSTTQSTTTTTFVDTTPTMPPSSSIETTTVSATTEPAKPQYTLAPGSMYNCVVPGHFPYQLDCIRFYRCFEVQPGVLKGLLYRCPAGYGFSTVIERCVRQETLPPCDRSNVKVGDFPIPIIPLEDTTPVLVDDFDIFFSNPNFFYQPRYSRFFKK